MSYFHCGKLGWLQASAAVAFALWLSASCGFAASSPAAVYRLYKGDTVEIDFPYLSDFNQTATVQPDGTLILKSVGAIHADGLTLPELHAAVETAYGSILKHPLLTIQPKDLEKPYFTALGSLNRPGKYELRNDLTLSEAIAIAGGFNDQSKTSQVVLFHKVNDRLTEEKLFNLKKMLASRNLRDDPVLRPGDMFFVPQNRLSKIGRFIPSPSVGTYAPL